MQLLIKQAKGNKDRYVNLSPVVLDILRQYLKLSKQRPVKYVFEGMQPGIAYNERSAQNFKSAGCCVIRKNKSVFITWSLQP